MFNKITNNCDAYYNNLLYSDLQRIESKDKKSLNKLRTYRLFKCENKFEDYLTYIADPGKRKVFTKFRISNHNLQIECGRHTHTDINLRFCQLCTNNKIESEIHFLLQCEYFKNVRTCFLDKLKNHYDIVNKTDDELFVFLMDTKDPFLTKNVSDHISKCLKIRKEFLSTHT